MSGAPQKRAGFSTGGRLGTAGYVRVIAALPGGSDEVGQRVAMRQQNAQRLLREMATLGLVHRGGHVARGPNNTPAVHWVSGSGQDGDVGRPDCRNSRPRAQLIAFAAIWRVLELGGCTAPEIVEATGVSIATVRRVIAEGRKRELVRVASWRPNHGHAPTAEYGLGSARSVTMPRRTQRQINVAYYWTRKRRAEQMAILRALAPANSSTYSEEQTA